jgi:hypothetical protein
MRKTAATSLILASALAAAAPASANWFARPEVGLNLNVGSAPNPTPFDLRALYGPSRYPALRISADVLRDMEGKTLYGENGEIIGVIDAVNEGPGLVHVDIVGGTEVTLRGALLINEPDRVVAPTLSHAEAVTMARAQTIGR